MDFLKRREMMFKYPGASSSPYSVAAMAALMSAFPTQWEIIKAYGFAHPALVPFINEDPMIIMSLIDGLGVREIAIGVNAQFVFTDIIELGDVINYKAKGHFQSGSRLGSSGSKGFFMMHAANYIRYYDTAWRNLKSINYTTYYDCSWDTGTKKVSIDSTEYTFNCYYTGMTVGISNDGENDLVVQFYEIEGKRNYVPCKYNGENGLLDTVSATFIQKTGAGIVTISETPAV